MNFLTQYGHVQLLVVIHDLGIVSPFVMPGKTDSPLVIDTDAVLTFAIALQCLELVAGGDPQAC